MVDIGSGLKLGGRKIRHYFALVLLQQEGEIIGALLFDLIWSRADAIARSKLCPPH